MIKKEVEGMLELSKKPKGVRVIEGFPGLGVVATIATGFLVDHLKCERIGSYYFEDAQPTLSIHDCKLIPPVGIYYNKQSNLVIVHAITPAIGIEWRAANIVLDLCKQLQAKELISIEGIGSAEEVVESKSFFFTTDQKCYEKIKKIPGVECLKEGIIIGVTSALLLKSKIPTTSFYADTHSKLPDSRAAAKIIETLDKYIGLKVDYKPLLQQAEQFETKLKTIYQQAAKTKDIQEKKELSYLG